MEFTLSDILTLRAGLDAWEIASIIAENIVIGGLAWLAYKSYQTVQIRERHKIIDKFIWWNARPVGGPLLFPLHFGLSAVCGFWLLSTWTSYRFFELPVIAILCGGALIFSFIALYRRSKIRHLYDDPFNSLAGTGIEHDVPKFLDT